MPRRWWLAICGLATGSAVAHMIESFSIDGRIAWTQVPYAASYRVEWAGQATGTWNESWHSLARIPATSATFSATVPMLYRVVANVPDVGVDYHAYGSNFIQTAFITIYHQPGIRGIVQEQLQGMADRGATRISTRLWMVTEPGTTNFGENWRATFPITNQEQANLRAYAEDVAAVQGTHGNRLRLDIGLLWLGAADYTRGTLSEGLGYTPLNPTTFAARVRTTTDKVLAAVSGINRPDGLPVVETIYLNGEVMVGAKANEGWFLTNHYPRFCSAVTEAGFTPSVYFIVADSEANVLQDNYVDANYSILNGHRSMYWMYRSMRYMTDHGLPLPPRIDFSFYVPPVSSTHAQLLTRVLADADATLPSLGAPASYGLAETFYYPDSGQRRALGQAIAREMATGERLRYVTFWTAPDGGGTGVHVAYPFVIEDYRLFVP